MKEKRPMVIGALAVTLASGAVIFFIDGRLIVAGLWGIASLLTLLAVKKNYGRYGVKLYLLFFCLGLLFSGVTCGRQEAVRQCFAPLEGENVTVSGRIRSWEERDWGARLVLDQVSVNENPAKKVVVNFYAPENEEGFRENARRLLHCLDKIEVRGKLSLPHHAENPGGYDGLLAARQSGEILSISCSTVKRIKRGGFSIRECLIRLRIKIDERLCLCYGSRDGGLLSAMLTGSKIHLEPVDKRLFEEGGISHLLAISGLHMSLLGLTLYALCRRVAKPSLSALLSLPVLLAYAVMAGFAPAQKRAFLMCAMLVVAQVAGRSYDRLSALAFSWTLLLFFHPWMLVSCGCLLSYGAVLALIISEKVLSKPQKSRGRKVWDAFFSGYLVWLFTIPVLSWFFFRFSLQGIVISPVCVVLLAPLLLGTVAGLFVPAGWQVALLPVKGILYAYRLLSGLPVPMVVTGKPESWQLLLFYLFLLLLILWVIRQNRLGRRSTALLLFGLAGLLLLFRIPEKRLSVVVLSVGQGDGILILSEKTTQLIDGGSSGRTDVGTGIIEKALYYYGRDHVDIWLLTHPDKDHVSGFLELMEWDFPVDTLLLSPLCNWEEVKKAAKTVKELRTFSRGEGYTLDQVDMVCLFPGKTDKAASENDASLVTRLKFGQFSMLFTGDVGKEQEEVIVQREKEALASLVLKVAHHGSRFSTSEAFLSAVSPLEAVISYGTNLYGHPSPEVLSRLSEKQIKIWETKKEGAVTILADRSGSFTVETERK